MASSFVICLKSLLILALCWTDSGPDCCACGVNVKYGVEQSYARQLVGSRYWC